MKKIKIITIATVSDEIAEEMKNDVLNGSFQRDIRKDGGVKDVKVTIEFLKNEKENSKDCF